VRFKYDPGRFEPGTTDQSPLLWAVEATVDPTYNLMIKSHLLWTVRACPEAEGLKIPWARARRTALIMPGHRRGVELTERVDESRFGYDLTLIRRAL